VSGDVQFSVVKYYVGTQVLSAAVITAPVVHSNCFVCRSNAVVHLIIDVCTTAAKWVSNKGIISEISLL